MYSLLSFIECYLVNLDTYQTGRLQVSHGRSLETLSNQELHLAKHNLKSVCGGRLRVVNLATRVRNAKHSFLQTVRIDLTNKMSQNAIKVVVYKS